MDGNLVLIIGIGIGAIATLAGCVGILFAVWICVRDEDDDDES